MGSSIVCNAHRKWYFQWTILNPSFEANQRASNKCCSSEVCGRNRTDDQMDLRSILFVQQAMEDLDVLKSFRVAVVLELYLRCNKTSRSKRAGFRRRLKP